MQTFAKMCLRDVIAMRVSAHVLRTGAYSLPLLLWLIISFLVPTPLHAGPEKKYHHPHPADKSPLSFVLSGTITNERDEPQAGASVSIQRTGKGTNTDLNGKFLIEVEQENDSIVVSFIGYKTITFRAGNQRTVNLKLEPDLEGQKMEEVQVVGFGTQKKTTMVGSVSSVSVTQLQKFSTPSLSNTIGGKLPGVITRQASGEPGYDAATVYIRGIVSQAGERRPLIIVDGVERELNNYWTTINVQEIENFSVLKDATATAVYGSRGANGVILITTKRGKIGKPKVTFRTETSLLFPMRISDYVNSYEYASLVNEASIHIGNQRVYTDEQLQKYRDQSDPYLYPDVSWNDVVFKKRTVQTINNVGITGGTENVKYYANLSYTLQQGIYNENDENKYKTNAALNRYNFRTNVDIKASKNFSIELGLSGIISNTNFPGTSAPAIFERLKLAPANALPLVNPNGSIPGNTGDLTLSPYSLSTQTGYVRQYYNTLVSNLGTKWDLSSVTPGLSVRGLAAFDVVDITQNIRRKTPATFLYAKNSSGQDVYTQMSAASALTLSNAYETYRTIYVEAAANYDRTVGKHALSGMILANRREFVNVATTSSIANLPERRQGIVGRVTYNFDTRYLLELNAAYNGSENFPKGKQYGLFPSIGAGWVVSNEKFWNSNVISTLKLRGSYGEVGNDRIGGARFLFQDVVGGGAGFTYGLGMNRGVGGIVESRIGNDDVTWELAKKTNLAVDLELFNGRITLTAEAFHERREDQLLQRRSIPVYTGFSSSTVPFANVGISTNKGVDAGLQVRNTTKSGFYYSFLANFTFAKNNIDENDFPPPLYPYQELRGHVINSNLGYEAIGFFANQEEIDKSPSQTQLMSTIRPGDIKYKDINGDNVINNADRTVIGKYGTEPQIMYGFGTTLAWKGFDFTIFFTGAARRDFFINARNFSMWAFNNGLGSYNVMQEYYDNRWVPGGADNSKARYPAAVPNSTNNYIISSLWYRNGAYLRIKNAEIGYTLPRSVLKRMGITSARFLVQGTNLATWDYIKIVDPESDFGTGGYPNTQSVNFGLEVNF